MFVGLVMAMGVGSSENCNGVLCGQGCNSNGCAASCGDSSYLNESYGCASQCDNSPNGQSSVTGNMAPDALVGCAEGCTAHHCGEMCSGTTCASQSIGDYSGQQCKGYTCKF